MVLIKGNFRLIDIQYMMMMMMMMNSAFAPLWGYKGSALVFVIILYLDYSRALIVHDEYTVDQGSHVLNCYQIASEVQFTIQ